MRKLLFTVVLSAFVVLAGACKSEAPIKTGGGADQGKPLASGAVSQPTPPPVTIKDSPDCKAYFAYQYSQLGTMVAPEGRDGMVKTIDALGEKLKTALPSMKDAVDAVTLVTKKRTLTQEPSADEVSKASKGSEDLAKWYAETCTEAGKPSTTAPNGGVAAPAGGGPTCVLVPGSAAGSAAGATTTTAGGSNSTAPAPATVKPK